MWGCDPLRRSCPLSAAPARAGAFSAPARGQPGPAAAPPRRVRARFRVERAFRAAQALLQLAGVQAAPGGGEQGLVVDGAKWAAFRDWFAKGLRTLKQVRAPRRHAALTARRPGSGRGRASVVRNVLLVC